MVDKFKYVNVLGSNVLRSTQYILNSEAWVLQTWRSQVCICYS